MNIKDLVEKVHVGQGITRIAARQIIDVIALNIILALSKGEGVELPGLGKFIITERKERSGRNPATGESLTIKAGRKVTFKAAKQLKDALN
jgi:DNA-binding protein HU-beta